MAQVPATDSGCRNNVASSRQVSRRPQNRRGSVTKFSFEVQETILSGGLAALSLTSDDADDSGRNTDQLSTSTESSAGDVSETSNEETVMPEDSR
jgi:hypothetical protein